MRKTRRTRTKAFAQGFFVCALVVSTLPLAFGQSSSGSRPDDRVVRERVEALLKQMTLEEKIGQLSQLFDFGEVKKIDEAVVGGHVGSLLLSPTRRKLTASSTLRWTRPVCTSR